jgi:hypothetical protein
MSKRWAAGLLIAAIELGRCFGNESTGISIVSAMPIRSPDRTGAVSINYPTYAVNECISAEIKSMKPVRQDPGTCRSYLECFTSRKQDSVIEDDSLRSGKLQFDLCDREVATVDCYLRGFQGSFSLSRISQRDAHRNWRICAQEPEILKVDSSYFDLRSVRRNEFLTAQVDRSLSNINRPLKLPSLPQERAELQQSSRTEDPGQANDPPIGRRFALLLGGVLGGFVLGIWGIAGIDNERRFGRAVAIFMGLLAAAGGLGLWWATLAYPNTWGWWL